MYPTLGDLKKAILTAYGNSDSPLAGAAHMELPPPEYYTQSAVSMFVDCQQMWFWRYVLGLTPKRIAKHFVTGNLVHLGLELLLKAHEGTLPRDPLDEHVPSVSDVLLSFPSRFEQETDKIQTESDMLSPVDCDMMEYSRVQALAMLDVWAEIKLPKLNDWNRIDVERTVVGIPIVEEEGKQPAREELFWSRAAGKLDGVFEHKQTGQRFLMEHKTRSRMDTFSFDWLALDQQSNWYLSLYEHATKVQLAGFLYNVIKKPTHRMSIKGAEDLRSRMRAAMLDNQEGYLLLDSVLADRTVMDDNLRNMVTIIKQMEETPINRITRNLGRCGEKGGCSYRPLCRAKCNAVRMDRLLKTDDLYLYDVKTVNSELELEAESE